MEKPAYVRVLYKGKTRCITPRVGNILDFKPYKIGKYLLLERIASGGMAEVYRAKASGAGGFEKEVAVKKILPSYSSNEDFRRMFEYEARLSNKLTHANIVQIFDFVKPGDSYLLAMEFVDGKNLRQLVNKIKKNNYILPIELSVYLINEVCKGLEYAHSKKDTITGKSLNIIHRDMSPQNIMISYEGAIKIVDFGIAKAKDRVDETRSGVIKGKFGYMSPEQANGENVDHRSDIFSTGIILWELVTGRRLFATENDLATLKLIQECIIPLPSKINPKVSQDLEKILLKTLTKDVRLRFQTAGALQRSLQEYLNKHHSAFAAEDVSKVMRSVFSNEILAEKKRFEQAQRQSIPYSQGEGKVYQIETESEEEAHDEEETHSEVEIDTAVTFGEENDEPDAGFRVEMPEENALVEKGSGSISNSKKSEKSDSSTIGRSVSSSVESGDATLVQGESSLKQKEKSFTGERIKPGLNIDKAPAKEKSVSIKLEDTDAEHMPVLSQKTVVTGPGHDLFDPEDEDTTGEAAITGSPISNPKSITVTKNGRPSVTVTPTQLAPNQNITNPSFNMDPAPERSLELDRAPAHMAPRRRPPTKREEDYYSTPKRKSSAAPFMLILLGASITLFLYKLLLSGLVPMYVKQVVPVVTGVLQERGVTQAPKASVAPQVDEIKPSIPAGECLIRIDSDPPGADVLINNQKKGATSITVSVPCGKDLNYELKLKGYDMVSENIYIRDKDNRIQRSLKKIPIGAVELYLSQNADIFVDGAPAGQATANQPHVVEMRAGVRHLLRMKNETLGIDSTQEVTVQEGFRQRLTLRLEDKANRKPGKK